MRWLEGWSRLACEAVGDASYSVYVHRCGEVGICENLLFFMLGSVGGCTKRYAAVHGFRRYTLFSGDSVGELICAVERLEELCPGFVVRRIEDLVRDPLYVASHRETAALLAGGHFCRSVTHESVVVCDKCGKSITAASKLCEVQAPDGIFHYCWRCYGWVKRICLGVF